MITILVIFCFMLVIAFLVAVITGLIAVSPILLLIICLPLVDYLVIKGLKSIFKKEKKKEE